MNQNIISMRASDGSVVKLECHDSLVSTVNLTRAYAKMGYPDKYVVMTEKRARLDSDAKVKGYDKGIFMSCLLRPSIFPSQATLIAPLSAVAFTLGLESHTHFKLGIGWVGKIYCEGEAIGEVAIEGKLDDFTSYEYMIVTFSCILPEDKFPLMISNLIKKVFAEEETTIPVIMAKDILNRFFPLYQNLKTTSKFMDAYKQKFILRGEKVIYNDGGKRRKYKVMGIDPSNCALLLEGRDKKVFPVFNPTSVSAPRKIRKSKKEE